MFVETDEVSDKIVKRKLVLSPWGQNI